MKSLTHALSMLVLTTTPAFAQPRWGSGPLVRAENTFKVSAALSFPADCNGPPLALVLSPPYTHTETRSANGVSFTITTTRVQSGNQVCLTTDLSDLKSKIPAMVANKAMPTNNCATYAHGNPVVEIYNSALGTPPVSEKMVFTMNGKMTSWACVPGPRIPRSEWVKQKGKIPYLRVWTEPGPDIKTIVHVKPFDTSIDMTLSSSSSGLYHWKDDEHLPPFANLVPQVDMLRLVQDALNAALPTLPHAQIPLVHIQGQRFYANKSQVWGTS